jgi:hypothetical protein
MISLITTKKHVRPQLSPTIRSQNQTCQFFQSDPKRVSRKPTQIAQDLLSDAYIIKQLDLDTNQTCEVSECRGLENAKRTIALRADQFRGNMDNDPLLWVVKMDGDELGFEMWRYEAERGTIRVWAVKDGEGKVASKEVGVGSGGA